MTTEAKQTKILAAIENRGWFTAEIYWKEANGLKTSGQIKMGDRYVLGGNVKRVWVAA